jgi:hypothetical protein
MVSSEQILVGASFVVELLVLGGFFAYPNGSVSAMIMVAALLVIPALLVGYFARKLGFTYGLVLGAMPAILGLSELPTTFFGMSRVEGAGILFFAYVLVSGVSGAAGQLVARWHDAD